MKVPRFVRYDGYLRALGLIIAGMVIGAALFLAVFSHNMNIIITENRELLSENETLMEETANLRKSKNQQTTINLLNIVNTELISAQQQQLDKITESELKRRIHKEFAKVVVGKKVSDFAESKELYEQILTEKPILGVLEKDYVINVKTMLLLGTELRVWVTVKEWKRLPSS